MAVLTSIEDVQPFINRETLEVDIESLKKDELLLIAEYGGYVLQIKLKQLENEAKEKDREDREKERKHEERQREHEERQREHEERQREHELKLAQLKFGVPEAYRQKFRELKKASNETYSEFARCKERLFEDWCNSRKVGNMQDMRELILLEEFKNCVPKDLKAHLEETQVETLKVAAELLDDSSLTHKKVYEDVEICENRQNACRDLGSKTKTTENFDMPLGNLIYQLHANEKKTVRRKEASIQITCRRSSYNFQSYCPQKVFSPITPEYDNMIQLRREKTALRPSGGRWCFTSWKIKKEEREIKRIRYSTNRD
ncbi:calponin homology domain-containing protein DDB_G0272472-like [Macrobrachium rosenbergii]|uniref:calponin homology domain-containing protein DDB_G0272472-like n=1 Tax=Macrobrachium rosenbergii TaxID=79674 RepID=UPI0034D4C4DA